MRGARVLGHQAVEPDGSRAVTGELVLGVAEERQRVVNDAESGGALHDTAEGDLPGEQLCA